MRLINYIPEPKREIDKPFMMPIEDVFSIKGRGTVVTGRIDRGVVHTSDPVDIIGLQEKSMNTVVTGVEMFHKLLDEGHGGRQRKVYCCAASAGKEVERGMVVAKPGSITPHTKFEGEVYVLTREEGGRHSAFFTGYRPQFFIPDDGCDGHGGVTGRHRDGAARRPCDDFSGTDRSGCPGERLPVRYP